MKRGERLLNCRTETGERTWNAIGGETGNQGISGSVGRTSGNQGIIPNPEYRNPKLVT